MPSQFALYRNSVVYDQYQKKTLEFEPYLDHTLKRPNQLKILFARFKFNSL